MQLSLMLTEVPGKNSMIAMCKRSGAISFEKSSGDELVEWVTGFLKVFPKRRSARVRFNRVKMVLLHDLEWCTWPLCDTGYRKVIKILALLVEGMKVKVLVTQSCTTLATPCTVAHRFLCPWNSSSKNTEVDRHTLLQGIFLTQRSNPSLLHCSQILYHLSH